MHVRTKKGKGLYTRKRRDDDEISYSDLSYILKKVKILRQSPRDYGFKPAHM